ncbi:MAG: 3-deoxy-D-manno-octulosonic acid kinase [Gammaproteobacteria bacterium]|nr:MAG: 3-deoxy-D-manno-octulosonic acid kinase [Gammaproteobacteria bacterium]
MSGRWPLGPEVKQGELEGGAMLYDASRVGNLNPGWFDPKYWEERGELDGAARGRGTTHFVKSAGRHFVLRHYRRGGLIAHLAADKYIWRGAENTRPFEEWQLTYRLHRAGLPVPAPLAARYRHRGLTYTGDLLTERVAVVGSLAECLRKGALSVLTWISIGRCVRRFHDLGVCHRDLNAHNVLLSEEAVYLIDFDRGELRRRGLWCDASLARLRRSLEKITWALPADRFGEADWQGLLDGYREAAASAAAAPS